MARWVTRLALDMDLATCVVYDIVDTDLLGWRILTGWVRDSSCGERARALSRKAVTTVMSKMRNSVSWVVGFVSSGANSEG
jgi:hypothetical protein